MTKDYHELKGKIVIYTNFECTSNCFACKSATVCTQCFNGYFLHIDIYIDKCTPGYLAINVLLARCLANNAPKAYKSALRVLKECPAKTVPYNGLCSPCNNPCDTYISSKYVLKCPNGTVKSGLTCEKCNPYYATCEGSPIDCKIEMLGVMS